MINFIIGLALGTFFAKYTRPVFEKIWAWCMEQYNESKSPDKKSKD